MLEEYLLQTCQKIVVTRNTSSDRVIENVTDISCRWRDITSIRRNSHSETNDTDAMVWFAPTSDADRQIARGDILLFNEVYYQVERITQAKTLDSDDPQFIKCEVKIMDIAIS